METKTKRWTLRVTPAQDAIVRQLLATTDMSLNEYVVGRAVASASSDLADRQVFALDPDAWVVLQDLLDRPPVANSKVSKLLASRSILDNE